MLDAPFAHPWQRFLRFSVRGLIVLVLVIGVSLGWLVRSARIQREAVAAIEHAGGSVSYDWEYSNGNSVPGGKPWAPRWLVYLAGVDYFGHVTEVTCFQPIDDTTIVQVGHLTALQRLNLYGTSTSDAWLGYLRGLTHLSVLQLGGDRHVTGAGLAQLNQFVSLSVLSLNSTQANDAGLAHLKGLTKLSSLDLNSTQITDAGIAYLKSMTTIKDLSINDTRVSDAGLAHLKALTNLSSLDLGSTHVTDAGVNELQQALPSLKITR